MNPKRCIGIASKEGSLSVAVFESGHSALEVRFPANEIGLRAIGIFIASCREPVRLAVAGAAALSVALTLGDSPGRGETFIVSSALAAHPLALAHLVGRMP